MFIAFVFCTVIAMEHYGCWCCEGGSCGGRPFRGQFSSRLRMSNCAREDGSQHKQGLYSHIHGVSAKVD